MIILIIKRFHAKSTRGLVDSKFFRCEASSVLDIKNVSKVMLNTVI